MEKLETVVTSFLRKICSEVTMPNFETSSSYLESGATFHSLRSCKRTRISLREILVCSTLNKRFLSYRKKNSKIYSKIISDFISAGIRRQTTGYFRKKTTKIRQVI